MNFDRGVHAAVVAPDPDEEVHRDEHRVPEHVEEEQIEREEHADHRALEQQHADRRTPARCSCTDSQDDSSASGVRKPVSTSEEQADAVHADEVARCRTRESRRGARRTGSRPTPRRTAPTAAASRANTSTDHASATVRTSAVAALVADQRARPGATTARRRGAARSDERQERKVHQSPVYSSSPPQVIPQDHTTPRNSDAA